MRSALLALALLSACASTPVATVSGGCDPGIEYQGRNLNLGASYGLVGISVGVSSGAVREVSDLMQIYMQEAANLCDLHARGALDALAYAERRGVLAERFARLVRVGQAVPPAEVETEALPLYRESLHALRPDAKGAPTAVSVRVEAEGRPLSSGAALRSGRGFRLSVETAGTAWVYVVLVNANDEVSRLYPAALTGGENPVTGRIEIPRDPGAEMFLDDRPGRERLFVFAERQRSPALEAILDEVDSTGRGTRAGTTLARGVGVRLAASEPTGRSEIGQATAVFEIDHRP